MVTVVDGKVLVPVLVRDGARSRVRCEARCPLSGVSVDDVEGGVSVEGSDECAGRDSVRGGDVCGSEPVLF